MIKNNSANETLRLNIKRLTYAIVTLLVFEGLVRKVLPSAVGLIVFFIKDILCVISLFLIYKSRANLKDNSLVLYKVWKALPIIFTPLFINTLFKDTLLPFFGVKQYLLYVGVAILVPLAFPPNKYQEFKRFISFFLFLIIPTTLIAMLQNSLPPTHWLNLSVGGDTLEAFSAAGYLRVSSTFSFTGQYSWFLNIVCAFLAYYICLPLNYKSKLNRKLNYLFAVLLSGLLIIGAFITGGRTAVIGCGACLFVGFLLASIKSPQKFVVQGVAVVIVLILSMAVLRTIKPEFFAAYDQRSSGTEERSHSEEVGERILGDFFGWTTWLFKEDVSQLLIGNGLGVMSNGADKLSNYASSVRAYLWTETDLATIVWEGGLYLLIVWYGFRVWVILLILRIWKAIKFKQLGIAMSFLFAYIIIIGLYGTISAQPPLAIWWWLSVGTVFTINNFYKAKVL